MITDKFLKAKHWQLFFLIIGVPLGSYFTLIAILSSKIGDGTAPPDFDFIVGIMKFVPFIMLFFASMMFSWLWSVSVGLQREVPVSVKMKTIKFKVFSSIPFLSIVAFCVAMLIMLSRIKPQDFPTEWLSLLVFPLQMLSAFGVFYTIYFAAKTLKTVELQKEVTFREFAGEFFMFWIFPIGLWFVQPRINDIIENASLDEGRDVEN